MSEVLRFVGIWVVSALFISFIIFPEEEFNPNIPPKKEKHTTAKLVGTLLAGLVIALIFR